MRYFKVRVSRNPEVTATICINEFHLKIYKEILRIKTDLGFGTSLKQWVKEDLALGNHPKVAKAQLENNLPAILASLASGHLRAFFTEDEVEVTEASEHERAVADTEENVQEQDGNVLQFIGDEE